MHSTKRAMLASASALPTALHSTVLVEPSHLETYMMGLQDNMTEIETSNIGKNMMGQQAKEYEGN